jgi:hypothetical protein
MNGVFMKNRIKARIAPLFGVIALAAVIGFTLITCDTGGGGGGSRGFIGVYGWSRNASASKDIEKLIKYYIVDDWFYNVQCGLDQIGTKVNGVNQGVELGSFAAYAGNSYISLSSPVAYQIVNLTGESRTDVMKVTNPGGYAVALYDLTAKKDTPVTITFSADVKRVGAAGTLNWQVNNSDYPSIGNPINNAPAGTWHTMSGTWTGTPTADNPSFYLSTYENNSGSTPYYIDNFTISVQ